MATTPTIEQCRACESRLLECELAMEPMPLAGGFCRTCEEAKTAPQYPLTWVSCQRCGLVQVKEDVPDKLLFSAYFYKSSDVPGLVRHFQAFSNLLSQRYDDGTRFLEVGCNDGVLLERLPGNWERFGIDPSDVAKRAATSAGYRYFEGELNRETVRQNGWVGTMNVVAGSNCMAHTSNLREIFLAAELALKPAGHLWVEVHDLESAFSGNQWDTIYHEHKAEWDEVSLVNCVSQAGFVLISIGRTSMHGGALRVLFEKRSAKRDFSRNPRVKEGLQGLRKAYEARNQHPCVQKLVQAVEDGESVCAYGASGRGKVFLNQVSVLPWRFVVDDSPIRAGTYIPSAGIPVVEKGHFQQSPTDHCLITAWNYKEDIIGHNPEYSGSWITAFGG